MFMPSWQGRQQCPGEPDALCRVQAAAIALALSARVFFVQMSSSIPDG